MVDETEFEKFRKVAEENPAYTQRYLAAISRAAEEVDRSDLATWLEACAKPATCFQSEQTIIQTLIRHGALSERIFIDGEPYSGDAHTLETDDTVPEGAIIEYRVFATETGNALLAALSPQRKTAKLFAEKPQHRRAFEMVLSKCFDGATRDEVVELLEADRDVLRVDPATNLPTVFPAYFVGALEASGALAWDGQQWRTTDEGRSYLESVMQI